MPGRRDDDRRSRNDGDDSTRDAETREAETSAPTTPASTVRDAPLVTALASEESNPRPRPSLSMSDLMPGEKLGDRYVVRGFLGRGGMGAVYHVFDEVLGEDVALKAVRSAIARSTGLRDEVKIAQKVTHDNVCRTYDLEDIGGRHFVKMEYVPGETLAARIEAGPLPITAAIRIARGVAAGLAAAHARGIVHRDLKPGNVMLDGDRTVLMDFGLAQYASHSEGDRSGTPGYMSPEQLAGLALDPRSDLFALGCLLHEMLTGERLYGVGSMTEIEAKQAMIEPPDVRVKRPDAPPWLARAVRLLLSREREPRTQGLELLKRGPPPSRWPLALAAAGVIAIGAGVAWYLATSEPAEDKFLPSIQIVKRPSASHETVSRASIALDSSSFLFISEPGDGRPRGIFRVPLLGGSLETIGEAPPLRPDQLRHLRDGSGVVFCGHLTREPHVYLQQGTGEAIDLGEGHDPDDCGDAIVAVRTIPMGDDYQRWELIALSKREGEAPVVLYAGAAAEPIDYPRCDSSGRRVLFTHYVADRPNVMMLDRVFRMPAERLVVGETASFTPGDRSIVYSERGALHELLLDDRRRARQLTDGSEPYYVPDVSPDGNVLLFAREDYASAIYLASPEEAVGRLLPVEMQFVERVHVNPDRTRVVLEWPRRRETIVVVDTRSGAHKEIAEGSRTFLARDGKQLYFVPLARPSELHAISLAGGPSRKVVEIPEHPIRDGVDGVDGIHVSVERFVEGTNQPLGKTEALRIPHGGGSPIAEGAGIVVPAPEGPWRARYHSETVEAFADGGRTRKTRCGRLPRWLDGKRLGCFVPPRTLEIIDVETGTTTATELPWPAANAFFAGDAEHWVAIRDADTVTRFAITNFATRPWAP